ncbi:ABC transporter ATP-binding protein [Ancylomarina euxinus]|uniref:ABC transporter ATP-binding protein n=1 Tax=Ancylomarina euxinus TaxID=2283627 RepID=A0A425Y087_9BACT|nr:ABC transporter ATP-binding protein [Ancylomarina euxinus]MCZ4695237.1 ABC transporter ATP-binding protein [Ancylomarina euxinus]MUP15434.1 ATP-binding cassette domain-containing protein [Ancylomarina euxinus]RRG21144.1 ABC transporter ATP-binding protein [Ancylomarina euxinus]
METNTVISIKNLHKSYKNGVAVNHVLKGLDLDIKSGQIIGYIGPNGAGKSTTVKILCGILTDFEGDIKVLGMDLRTQDLDIKKRIGYIPENAALYDTLTPSEYLQFVGELQGMEEGDIQTKTARLLDLFEMKSHADERMNSFSKGMKQKILIISGLIHNPDIIFMDEPLSGLDANAVIIVKRVLQQLAREGKTIFYSSHIMDVVEKISDRIILIDNGVVLADGSYAELNSEADNESLETLFTKLTGNSGHSETANEIINVFEN